MDELIEKRGADVLCCCMDGFPVFGRALAFLRSGGGTHPNRFLLVFLVLFFGCGGGGGGGAAHTPPHRPTQNTVLDEKQASFCVRQVLAAVEFLHGKGIVHRDIKPANILVLSSKCR